MVEVGDGEKVSCCAFGAGAREEKGEVLLMNGLFGKSATSGSFSWSSS